MVQAQQDADFLKTLTVLYVEDDDDVRQQMSQFLRRRVGTLITADNGVEGLNLFSRGNVHMVVTDILMPGMDGLDMATAISELDNTIPIIITTASEQTEFLVRSIDIGIYKYVPKPIRSDVLYAALLASAQRLRHNAEASRQSRQEAQDLRVRHMEMMGKFAGGMAHDFNNLLQVILGGVYLAKSVATPESEVNAFLAMTEESSAQACDLGKRLLLLANRSKPSMKESSLTPLIMAVVISTLGSSQVTPRFHLPDDLPCLWFNMPQMQQVLTSIVSNAVDAMPQGGTLTVTGESCTIPPRSREIPLPEGEYVHYRFSDTGHGIAPADLPQIFDPYFSTKGTGSQKGMGLSLAVCNIIVTSHNGFISAESGSGEGATFHLYLPAAMAPAGCGKDADLPVETEGVKNVGS